MSAGKWILAMIALTGAGFLIWYLSMPDQRPDAHIGIGVSEREDAAKSVVQATVVRMKLSIDSDEGTSQEVQEIPANEPFELAITFEVATDRDELPPLTLKIIKHKSDGDKVIYQTARAIPTRIENDTFEAVFDVSKVQQAGEYQLLLDCSRNSKFPYHVFDGPVTVAEN